jgi:GTPase
MFGLMGFLKDYFMILEGANMGVIRMTNEHLVSLALKIHLFIINTKFEIAPKNVYNDTVNTFGKNNENS